MLCYIIAVASSLRMHANSPGRFDRSLKSPKNQWSRLQPVNLCSSDRRAMFKASIMKQPPLIE